MREPYPVLRNFSGIPSLCPTPRIHSVAQTSELCPHFVIQGPPNTDRSAEAVSRYRGRATSRATALQCRQSHKSQGVYCTVAFPCYSFFIC